jgi:hypothetical protein
MPHLLVQLLLADIFEVLGALVGLIALVFWVIQRIIEATKEAGPQGRPAGQPPQAQAAPPGAPRPAGQQADPLRGQVEEFLRRAGQGQQPNQGGAAAPRRPAAQAQEIEVLLDDEALAERRPARQPLRPREEKPAAASRPAASAKVPGIQRTQRRPVTPRERKSLAERSSERAAARAEALAQKVSHLGKRVIEEDQQFDVQLKAKFDHTVGTLAGQTVASSELVPVESTTAAGQIAAMLANPDGVRQAIILNEILRRPMDRW